MPSPTTSATERDHANWSGRAGSGESCICGPQPILPAGRLCNRVEQMFYMRGGAPCDLADSLRILVNPASDRYGSRSGYGCDDVTGGVTTIATAKPPQARLPSVSGPSVR